MVRGSLCTTATSLEHEPQGVSVVVIEHGHGHDAQCQDPVCCLLAAPVLPACQVEKSIYGKRIGCGICDERCRHGQLYSDHELEREADRARHGHAGSGLFSKGGGKERGRRSLPMAESGPWLLALWI